MTRFFVLFVVFCFVLSVELGEWRRHEVGTEQEGDVYWVCLGQVVLSGRGMETQAQN